jgi:3-oxoacyl-[acyl-carrier-protein] synthase-3
MRRSVIIGCGSYLPEKVLTNRDLEKMVETSDSWIEERTGIKKRHIIGEKETTADMAAKAARMALSNACIKPEDVDLIVVATTTPDNTFPSTATRVQHLLGAKKGAAFDVQAVCAGFIYALSVTDNFIKTGQSRCALVIGADALSRIVDWTDRGTCILFGDGAGAVVLTPGEMERGILSTHLYSDGSTRDLLYVDGGPGSNAKCGVIHMEGKEVFRHAVQKLSDVTLEALAANHLDIKELDWLVPHQANLRILDAVARRLELPAEKVITTVAEHANTSAASIPLAIHVAVKQGKFKKGQLICLEAIGGGLAWGSALLRW